MKREVLRMERVTYKKGDVTLLRDFELNIAEGEIVGLLPLNAYGLPDFLQLLGENLPLHDGYIYYKEKLVDSWQHDKQEGGKICIIQDKSSLVGGQSVLTNIFVLRHGFRQEIIKKGLLKQQLRPFLDEIDADISMDMLVEKLTVFERIIVEILRAVVGGYGLIVLQEIDTLISGCELDKLYEIMRYYTQKGFAFLCISPHFEELERVCGRVAVMSNGKVIKVLLGDQMCAEMLTGCAKEYQVMVRKRLERQCTKQESDKVLFEVKSLWGDYIRNLNFTVEEGECVVLQSLDEKIFTDLVSLFSGKTEKVSGVFCLDGERTRINRNRDIAVIAEQPTQSMLFYGLNYMDNLCFSMDHRVKGVWRNHKVKHSIEQEYRRMLGESVFHKSLDELTEIEKYELVYARILLQKPKIVFCIQPFKGADLRHRIRIWELQEMLLRKGIAVVILAVNMADALSLADRVIRIDTDMRKTEYGKEDFGKLPVNVPWKFLYDRNERK